MRPPTLLPFELRNGIARPHYLSRRDEPWVRLLIEELDALVGRTQGDAARVFAQKSVALAATHDVPAATVRMVQRMLIRRWRTPPAKGVPSSKIRRVVADLGSDPSTPRDEVIRRAASVLGIRAEQVSAGFYADRSPERRLAAPPVEPSPAAVVADYNVAVVEEFLMRAEELVVHAGAHAAPLLRAAKERGLMYAFALGSSGAVITLPGPVSLFRQTVRYERALVSLLPAIAAIPGWAIDAKCLLGATRARFRASSADPIAPVPGQSDGDPVERRFLADFRRLGSRWSIARSLTPLRAGSATFFPDFTLERAMDRVLVEIVGFHTASYLEAKQSALEQAGLSSVILCVDDSRACSERAAAFGGSIFHFQKRIAVGPFLHALERLSAARDGVPDSDQPSS